MHNLADNEWVTVANAARILGVSKQAVRQRVYRGTIPHTKDESGVVYVRVTQPNAEGQGETNDVDNTVLLDYVETLKGRIRHLEEESSRKDTIIMSLTQRIPEIEAPSERQRSPETASEGVGRGDHPPEPYPPVERPSWWRRFFGFE